MKLPSYFALIRLPTIFSSMSNAYAGYLIAGGRTLSWALGAGLIAAAVFIAAGMALNDIADYQIDAEERPNRPLPSGAITLKQAWTLSLVFMLGGLLLLFFANPLSAGFALALCLSIFAYNFSLKGSFWGPASMGLCRLLNLLTGMSLAWKTLPLEAAVNKSWGIALFSLWGYIALVTYLARDEVQGNKLEKVRYFLIGLFAWCSTWLILSKPSPDKPSQSLGVILLIAIGWFLHKPLTRLIKDPSPAATGQTIGMLLRLLPLVDGLGMLTNSVPPLAAFTCVLFVFPAWAIGKFFYST